MDSLTILFTCILLIALLLILLVNLRNHQRPFVFIINNLERTKEGFGVKNSNAPHKKFNSKELNFFEGFEDSQNTPPLSPLALQIRSVLDPMVGTKSNDLCELVEFIRKRKIEDAIEKKYDETKPIDENLPPQELPSLTQSEAEKKVDAELALQIPGGPLPCPLLTYPKPTATDLEWLDFLQKLPSDFGARVVLMALYARNTLQKGLTDILEIKNAAAQVKTQEPFTALCPPSVADTRRAERKNKEQAGCTLPEDAAPQVIKTNIEETLKKLVSEKTTILKGKDVDPFLNLDTLVNEALAYKVEIEKEQATLSTLPAS